MGLRRHITIKLNVLSASLNKAFPSFLPWTDVFIIFMNCYVSAHPDIIHKLLEYLRSSGWQWRNYGGGPGAAWPPIQTIAPPPPI